MKKIIATLLIFSTVLSFAVGAVTEESAEYADVGDAMLVLRDLVGLESSACVSTHDFNSNDVLDVGDAMLVLRSLVGLDDPILMNNGHQPVETTPEPPVTTYPTTEATTATEVTSPTTDTTTEVTSQSAMTTTGATFSTAETTTEVTSPTEPCPYTLALCPKVELRIRKDWFEFAFYGCQFITDVSQISQFQRYLGTYNGNVVFVPYHGVTMGLFSFRIRNVMFRYRSAAPIFVWSDGTIHRIRAVYDEGLLTKQDLKNVFNIYARSCEMDTIIVLWECDTDFGWDCVCDSWWGF